MARRHDTATGETLDEIQSGADRLGAYLQEHLREVVIAVVALLLLAGGVSLWLSSRERSEEAASIALDAARSDYLSAMGAPPGALDVPELANPDAAKRVREDFIARYGEIADEHAGSVAGALARLEVASLQQASGDDQAALETLAALRAEAPDRPGLQGMILQAEAQALERANRLAEAADRHEQAAAIEGYPLRHYALADAARTRALAGDLEAASALYARLDTEAPDLRLPEYQRMQRRELAQPETR
jgi:type II secretory pathway pseudopilin PulG